VKTEMETNVIGLAEIASEIFAIDPGPAQSAWLEFDLYRQIPKGFGIVPNPELLHIIYARDGNAKKTNYVIEMVQSFGMPVGKDIFQTCVWTGRFIEAICQTQAEWSLLYRRDVKMHLCNSTCAKDSNIRQALIDRFGPSGGGKVPQIGTKANPGPLYGIARDIWSALALAVTYAERQERAVKI